MKHENRFVPSLIGGGLAGFSVDIMLYPIDTLKTRLQAAEGFLRSGGFRGIYAGLSVAAIGSVPGGMPPSLSFDFSLFLSSFFLPSFFPSFFPS